jgi:hypothetical protein
VTSVVGMVAAALVNCLIFGVASAVDLLVVTVLLSPGSPVPVWLGLILALLFAVIMLFALKPVTKLTKMATPAGVFKGAGGSVGDAASAIKSGGKFAAKAAVTGGVSALGAHAALQDHLEDVARRRSEAQSQFGEQETVEYPPADMRPPVAPEQPALPAAPARQQQPVAALPVAATTPETAPVDAADEEAGSESRASTVTVHGPAWPAAASPYDVEEPPYADVQMFTPDAAAAVDTFDSTPAPQPVDPTLTDEGAIYDIYSPEADLTGPEMG